MEFSSFNNIIKLFFEGMDLEEKGKPEEAGKIGTAALQLFMSGNIDKIDMRKILIRGPAYLPYGSFRPLLEFLPETSFTGFRIVISKQIPV